MYCYIAHSYFPTRTCDIWSVYGCFNQIRMIRLSLCHEPQSMSIKASMEYEYAAHSFVFVSGNVQIVELLLRYKARPYRQSGMCYPRPHVPCYESHSSFFFVNRSMVCGGSTKDAYQRAIDGDDTLMLNILLENKCSNRLLTVSLTLPMYVIKKLTDAGHQLNL